MLNVTYPGLPILEVLLEEGAADLARMGLHTESISGCRAERPSMKPFGGESDQI